MNFKRARDRITLSLLGLLRARLVVNRVKYSNLPIISEMAGRRSIYRQRANMKPTKLDKR